MNARSLTLLAGLTALLALPAQAQFRTLADDDWCRDRGGSRQERFCEVREATLAPTRGALRVDAAPNGGIEVEGWDRGEIRLRAKVVAAARTEAEARQIASEVHLETSPEVRADGPRASGDSHWSVSYRLSVPRRSDLSLHSSNGGISIAEVQGEIEFETTNGGVHLTALSGNVTGRTTNGGLNVRLAGTQWAGQGLDVKTTNGGVTLSVPENYNAHLETATVNGGIRVDFPVSVQGRIDRSLSVDLGSGGRPLRVATTNGAVVVRRR
jgi:hypothetical protein